jgi:hypothetical protein
MAKVKECEECAGLPLALRAAPTTSRPEPSAPAAERCAPRADRRNEGPPTNSTPAPAEQSPSIRTNESRSPVRNGSAASSAIPLQHEPSSPMEATEQRHAPYDACPNPSQGAYSPTMFNQIPPHSSWSIDNPPYCSYLESIQHVVPGVSDLVSLISAARSHINEFGHRTPSQSYVPGEHIVVGEIPARSFQTIRWHDINCTDSDALTRHSQILSGTGSLEDTAARYLVMDDFSPKAIEVLGNGLSLDPHVFLKHLHQSIEGCAVENYHDFQNPLTGSARFVSPRHLSTGILPSTLRDIFSSTERSETHVIVVPTDMHVAPIVETPPRIQALSRAFEERQAQRVPRCGNLDFDDSILYHLGCLTFMRPSLCEDFGPYLPLWPAAGDDGFRHIPFQRITFDRSDHVLIHVVPKTIIPTSKYFPQG